MALVFVLEDEVTMRAIYARALAGMKGVSFLMAANLAEARELLDGLSPDVCILDLRLPDGHGLELLDVLSAKSRTCAIAVVSDFAEEVPLGTVYSSSLEIFPKPPPIDALRALIRREVQNLERRGPFTLPEYIQLACMGGHSVVFDVWSAERAGQVAVAAGQLWSACYGDLTGFGALATMLNDPDLHVSLHKKEVVSGPRQMVGEWQGLLIEAARLYDEAHRNRSDSIVPEELDFSDVLEADHGPDTRAPESDLERKFRELVEAGVRAVIRRDYPEAAGHFEGALGIRPQASEVRHRLDRLHEVLAHK